MNILLAIAFLTCGIFGLLGATLLVIGIASQNKAVSADQWPTVSGKIIQSGVAAEGAQNPRPEIVYEYEVKGVAHTGRRVRFGEQRFSEAQAQAVAARYPAGQSVEVRYNRAHPEDSVLEVQPSNTRLFLIAGGALLIVALLSFCLAGFGLLSRG